MSNLSSWLKRKMGIPETHFDARRIKAVFLSWLPEAVTAADAQVVAFVVAEARKVAPSLNPDDVAAIVAATVKAQTDRLVAQVDSFVERL